MAAHVNWQMCSSKFPHAYVFLRVICQVVSCLLNWLSLAEWLTGPRTAWWGGFRGWLIYLLILACYESTNKLNEKQQNNKQQQIQRESIGDWNHISAIALEPNVVKLLQVEIMQHKKNNNDNKEKKILKIRYTMSSPDILHNKLGVWDILLGFCA